MINLLPPQEKQKLLEEEKYRIFLILVSLGFLFLVSLSLILFSIKIYIAGQTASQKIFINLKEEEFATLTGQNLEKEIRLINQNLSKLNSFYQQQPNFSELLEKIYKTLPPQTYLTTFSLRPLAEEENIFQVSLTGYCPSRELLREFKRNLEAQPEFEEVYFPLANWVKLRDIDFSVTFQFSL